MPIKRTPKKSPRKSPRKSRKTPTKSKKRVVKSPKKSPKKKIVKRGGGSCCNPENVFDPTLSSLTAADKQYCVDTYGKAGGDWMNKCFRDKCVRRNPHCA